MSTTMLSDEEAQARRARHRAADARIGTLSAQIHALEAELVEAVCEYHDAGGIESSDYRSLSQWFSIRTKFTPGDSRRITTHSGGVDTPTGPDEVASTRRSTR